MALCRPRTCCLVSAVTIGVLSILVAAVLYPVLDKVIKDAITKQVVLTNGSQLYDTWKEPTIPVYLQVYIFDLQNPEEVKKGSKPIVIQRGPFTYNEHKVKLGLTHHENGTVTYRQNTTYRFNRKLSAESEDVRVTSINIPLLVFAEQLKHISILPRWLDNFIQVLSGELVFINRTVHEIVWGYNDHILEFLKNHQIPLIPFHITDTKVGIFANRNNTNDGEYTIFTGEKNITLLGVIDKYNGKSSLEYWTSPQANMINGSDGTLCPPFIVSKNLRVDLFSTDICRSVYGVYQKDVETSQGINLYRYSAPKEVFENFTLNPDNAGFCTPEGNCLGTGVLNISTCQSLNGIALPIVVSYPHFFMAAQEYQDAIEGLNPGLPNLSTDIDIEPHTGLVMQIAKRLQINVHVEPNDKFIELKNLRKMIYPVLWVNESVHIDDKSADKFKSQVLLPINASFVIQLVLFGVGGLLLLASMIVCCIWIRGRKEKDVGLLQPSEDDPTA